MRSHTLVLQVLFTLEILSATFNEYLVLLSVLLIILSKVDSISYVGVGSYLAVDTVFLIVGRNQKSEILP